MRKSCYFFLLGYVLWQPMLATNYPALSVLISELMPDPTPAIQLPPYEYVELSNHSPDTLDLHQWIWQVGTRSVTLPPCQLAPNASVLLLPPAAKGAFSTPNLCLDKWLTLPNAGQYLVLKDPEGKIIHFVRYSPAMFADVLQASGGRSLELTNWISSCATSSWSPSEDPSGGTPGSANTRNDSLLPAKKFAVWRSGYVGPSTGFLVLSDYLHLDTPPDALQYTIPPFGPVEWSFYLDQPNLIQFVLPTEVAENQLVEVGLSGDFISCSGDLFLPSACQWGIPATPDSADLLISEILFDPTSGGVEFVEIYNSSNRMLEVNELILATADANGRIKDFTDGGDLSCLIRPDEFVAITADPLALLKAHPDMPAGNMHQRRDLPALANSGGTLILMSRQQSVLDQATYHPDYHYPRLSETKGVSLERVSFHVAGTQPNNWFSASQLSGFATPGASNSQFTPGELPSDIRIELSSEVISPDQDGYLDQAVIRFQMESDGFVGEFQVRDLSGQLIRVVHAWGLLPREGQFIWDGTDQNRHLVSEGIYILLINYRHPDKRGGRWKKAVALWSH